MEANSSHIQSLLAYWRNVGCGVAGSRWLLQPSLSSSREKQLQPVLSRLRSIGERMVAEGMQQIVRSPGGGIGRSVAGGSDEVGDEETQVYEVN